MRSRIVPLCALAVGLAACQPEVYDWRDDYDWVWEGKYVTVYGYERAQDRVCGGSFAAMELHSRTVAEFFGDDGDLHYDYLWLSPAAFEGKCRPGASACTASGVPWTRSIPHMHEITHAVSYSRGYHCSSVLEEGIAEYFGTPRFHSFFDGTSGDYPIWIGDVLTDAPLSGGDYERAGNFASFLIEEHGSQAVARLCGELPYFSTLDDWHAAVPEVLGIQLSELLAAYEAYPQCFGQQYRARAWECAGEPHATASPDEEVVFEVAMDCADEGVLGPLGSQMVATRRIAFPEDMRTGVFLRDASGEDVTLDFDFNLQECAACSELPQVRANADIGTTWNFRAGMYELLIYADLERSETLSVHLVPS